MTAAALTPSKEYIENGVTLAYAVPFRFRAATHIKAQRISTAGVVTELVYGTDYSVTGGTTDAGGTLMVTVAGTAGVRLRIRRETPRVQDMDYTTGDTFAAESHEGALDKAMLIDQEQDQKIDDTASRALMVPDAAVAPEVILTGLLDGDILQYLDSKIVRLPRENFAGKYYGGDALGRLTPLSGTGNDAAFRYDAAQPNGSLLFGFQQAGVAALHRTGQDKLRELVSVDDFIGADLETRIDKALDRLADVGGGVLFFPPSDSDRLIGAELPIVGVSNVTFSGQMTKIKGAGSAPLQSLFKLDGCSNIEFRNMRFDMRFGELPTYASFALGIQEVPIFAMNGTDGLNVSNCLFEKLYTVGILGNNASNISVERSVFRSPLQDQDQKLSFIEMLSCGGVIDVLHSRFHGAATTVNGKSPSAVSISGLQGKTSIVGNYAEYCGRNNEGAHRLAVFDIYADAANVTISDNVAVNCREQFIRASSCVDVVIERNKVTIALQVDVTYSTLSIESGFWTGVVNSSCQRIRVVGNDFRCLGNRQAFAIGLASYDWGADTQDIKVENNILTNYDIAINASGPMDNVSFSKNTARNVSRFLELSLTGGLTLSSILGVEADSAFDDVHIDDNIVQITAGVLAIPINISTNRVAPYTGRVGRFYFRRNSVTGTPGGGTQHALNVIFNAPSGGVQQGIFIVESNDIFGYVKPFLLRSLRRAEIKDNYCPTVTDAFVETDGCALLIEQIQNRRSERGARSGSATLIAGTRTINTSEIMAGDRVRVWREVSGGTIGDLICDPANHVVGTSIRIDSSNAADTSTVGWEIVGR